MEIIFFSDESRLNVESDTRRVLIWKEQETRNNPAFVQERSPNGGGGLMV